MISAKIDLNSKKRFINRELSWLSFNERVLKEANNNDYPLLERLKFLSISGNNLDEFHMVRVAGISRQIKNKIKTKTADGRTPVQQLQDVNNSLRNLLYQQQKMWIALKEEMLENDMKVLYLKKDFESFHDEIKTIFHEVVFPSITPMAIDPVHPFPFLPNLSSSLVLSFQDKKKKR